MLLYEWMEQCSASRGRIPTTFVILLIHSVKDYQHAPCALFYLLILSVMAQIQLLATRSMKPKHVRTTMTNDKRPPLVVNGRESWTHWNPTISTPDLPLSHCSCFESALFFSPSTPLPPVDVAFRQAGLCLAEPYRTCSPECAD